MAVLAGVAGLVGVAAFAAPALRTPEEQVEARVSAALSDAGVRLGAPVDLASSGGEAPVFTGRLAVRGQDGSVTRVRIAVRPDNPTSLEVDPGWLFPAVDCDAPYPLTWLGDSDSSYRTTRADLAECISQEDYGELRVTISWRRETRQSATAGETGWVAVGRQTWRIDTRGGVAWLDNNGNGELQTGGGLTARQQQRIVGTDGLLGSL